MAAPTISALLDAAVIVDLCRLDPSAHTEETTDVSTSLD
jgi:hypothetical protein